MRMMLTVQMDTERTNKAIASGKLGGIMKATVERLKPEAAYFGAQDGRRTGFFVFDLAEASDIPSLVEPLFQELDVRIDVIPVMDLAGVQSGLQKYQAG